MSSRVLRVAIGTLGVVVLVAGLRGVWVHRVDTRPWLGAKDLVAFWLGGALLHDLLVAPLTLAVALVVRRAVPHPLRSWALGALVVSATTTLMAWPALRGYGERPDNPTILPRDEWRGLAIILALVWTLALAGAATSAVMRRQTRA